MALSEFYLDTELDGEELSTIARSLASSPYSIAELHAIERYEVAPVLWGNLIQTAGEWAGWDEAGLTQACAAKAELGRGPKRRFSTGLFRRWVRFMTGRYWDQVEPEISTLRAAA